MLTADSETRQAEVTVEVARPARTAAWRLVDAEAAWAALWPFLATRLLFMAIALAAPLLFTDHATRQLPTGAGWIRWDAQWFIATAQHGYPWRLFANRAYSTIAFFPLYPLLIRAVALAGVPIDTAALLIPNVALGLALYYLYRLVRLDFSAETAARATWLLAVFPTALAFFIPYSESLYLLCAVVMFWHLRRGRWLAAGVAGALGALTRQSGIVLALPYLIEWYGAYFGERRASAHMAENAAGRAVRNGAARMAASTPAGMMGGAARALLPVLVMPLAVGAHVLYLWHVTGSLTAFLQIQRAWHRRLDWPWAGVIATVQRWSLPDSTGYQTGHQVHIVMELGALALFVALLVVGARRLRPSYTVYGAAVWLAALISPAIADDYWLPIMSSSRFALSVFPSFIVLALLLRRPGAYQAWLVASAMALGILATYFYLGGWVA